MNFLKNYSFLLIIFFVIVSCQKRNQKDLYLSVFNCVNDVMISSYEGTNSFYFDNRDEFSAYLDKAIVKSRTSCEDERSRLRDSLLENHLDVRSNDYKEIDQIIEDVIRKNHMHRYDTYDSNDL